MGSPGSNEGCTKARVRLKKEPESVRPERDSRFIETDAKKDAHHVLKEKTNRKTVCHPKRRGGENWEHA